MFILLFRLSGRKIISKIFMNIIGFQNSKIESLGLEQ